MAQASAVSFSWPHLPVRRIAKPIRRLHCFQPRRRPGEVAGVLETPRVSRFLPRCTLFLIMKIHMAKADWLSRERFSPRGYHVQKAQAMHLSRLCHALRE
jgi:hypothetical protein